MKRYLIPLTAFLLGATLVAGIYFGILIAAQGKDAALSIFLYGSPLPVCQLLYRTWNKQFISEFHPLMWMHLLYREMARIK